MASLAQAGVLPGIACERKKRAAVPGFHPLFQLKRVPAANSPKSSVVCRTLDSELFTIIYRLRLNFIKAWFMKDEAEFNQTQHTH